MSETTSQVISCGRKFEFGFLPLTHLQTTTFRAKLSTQELQHGFFKARSSPNGKGMVASCGSTENVCVSREFPHSCAYDFQWALGRASFCRKYLDDLHNDHLYMSPAPQSLRTSRTFVPPGWPVLLTTILTLMTPQSKIVVDFYARSWNSSALSPARATTRSFVCTRLTLLAREKLLTQDLHNVSKMCSSSQDNLQLTSLWTPSMNVPISLGCQLRVKRSWN